MMIPITITKENNKDTLLIISKLNILVKATVVIVTIIKIIK